MKYVKVNVFDQVTKFIAVSDNVNSLGHVRCLEVNKIGDHYHVQVSYNFQNIGLPITKQEFDSEYDNAINSFMPFLS